MDVIDYLVKVVGVDHVSIGTDFTEGQPESFFTWVLVGKSRKGPIAEVDYPIVNPEGIRSSAEFPNITRTLLSRGYSESEIKKIMGENLMSLFETVWD